MRPLINKDMAAAEAISNVTALAIIRFSKPVRTE